MCAGVCMSDHMHQMEKTAPRDVPKKESLEETAKASKVLGKFESHNITNINYFFCAGVVVVAKRLGPRRNNETGRKEQMKRRIVETKIKELRYQRDSGRQWERLGKKYDVSIKTLKVFIEELKERVLAFLAKVKRYQERIIKRMENRMFQNNQRQFCKELKWKWIDLNMRSLMQKKYL